MSDFPEDLNLSWPAFWKISIRAERSLGSIIVKRERVLAKASSETRKVSEKVSSEKRRVAQATVPKTTNKSD